MSLGTCWCLCESARGSGGDDHCACTAKQQPTRCGACVAHVQTMYINGGCVPHAQPLWQAHSVLCPYMPELAPDALTRTKPYERRHDTGGTCVIERSQFNLNLMDGRASLVGMSDVRRRLDLNAPTAWSLLGSCAFQIATPSYGLEAPNSYTRIAASRDRFFFVVCKIAKM